MAQVEGESKFRALGEADKLNQSLVNTYSVPIEKWGQQFELIVYEAKNENLEGLCLALTGRTFLCLM